MFFFLIYTHYLNITAPSTVSRGDHFRFGLVVIKKSNQIEFLKKNQNRIETGSNRPVLVQFGFLGQKSIQTDLAWFFQFGFGSIFSVFCL